MAAADRQDARKSMMLEQPISRIIPKMAIPTIVAFLINSIYSLADTFSSAPWAPMPRQPSASTPRWTRSS